MMLGPETTKKIGEFLVILKGKSAIAIFVKKNDSPYPCIATAPSPSIGP